MKRGISGLMAFILLFLCLPGIGLAANDRAFLINTISVLDDKDIPASPSGVHHYLLIGMDKWQNNPENPGYNDGLVILTFDEISGRVMVTSIIRDLLVIKPDGNPGRINRIVRQFGPQALLDTINRHFGLQVDKYVLMDWRHIMEIVVAAGGVTVRLTGDEANYLKHWSVPVNSTEPVLSGAGEYHLNGFAAVIYMRIRKRRTAESQETQDFGRTSRVRTVLSGIAGNLRNYTMDDAQALLGKVLNIWDQPFDKRFTYPGIRNNGIFTFGVTPKDPTTKRYATNISMLDLVEALRVAFLLRNSEVEQLRLPFDGMVKPYIYAGGDCQLGDFTKIRERLHDIMFPETFLVADE